AGGRQEESLPQLALGEETAVVEARGQLERPLEVGDGGVDLRCEDAVQLDELEEGLHLEASVAGAVREQLGLLEREACLFGAALLLERVAEPDESLSAEVRPTARFGVGGDGAKTQARVLQPAERGEDTTAAQAQLGRGLGMLVVVDELERPGVEPVGL